MTLEPELASKVTAPVAPPAVSVVVRLLFGKRVIPGALTMMLPLAALMVPRFIGVELVTLTLVAAERLLRVMAPPMPLGLTLTVSVPGLER